MKFIFLFVSLLVISVIEMKASSDSLQTDFVKKPQLYFLGGIAFPQGDFKESENFKTDSYAQIGRSFGIGFVLLIYKGVYIDLSYSNKTFTVDKEKFDKNAEMELKDGRIINGIPADMFKYTSAINLFKNSNISLGFRFEKQLTNVFSMYLTPSIAISWLENPIITIGLTYDEEALVYSNFDSRSSSALTYSIEGGIRSKINKNLSVLLNLDYLDSEHTTEFEIKSDINTVIDMTEITDHFTALTLSMGLQLVIR